jgi:hypothetical protein
MMIFDRPRPNMIAFGFPAFLIMADMSRRGAAVCYSISFFVGSYALYFGITWSKVTRRRE